jgi:hypothetical protein
MWGGFCPDSLISVIAISDKLLSTLLQIFGLQLQEMASRYGG